MDILMVDLKSQYQKLKVEIDKAISDVIDSATFIRGSEVTAFQNELGEFVKAKHVITCGNGTDAILLALMALNLQSGDEVITTDFSFVATVEAIAILGLKPVLVDVDPDTYTIDTNLLEKSITRKTKAIIPVHLFGQCAQMEQIMEIANKYNLYVIEDAAQSLGAEYLYNDGTKSHSGTIGHIGCTSFFPTKNLGCYGDGGALFTNDSKFADLLYSIANHGMSKRYYYDRIGVNSRLDTLQAAILRVKLRYLTRFNESRANAALIYDEAFKWHPKLKIPFRTKFSTHIFNQYTLVTRNVDRDELQKYLIDKGIPTHVYYPLPLHLQNAYKYLNYREGDFPITERLCKSVISLPMHTELHEEQINFITKTLLDFID